MNVTMSANGFKYCFNSLGSTFKCTVDTDEEIKTEQTRREEIVSGEQESDEKKNKQEAARNDCQESMSKLAWFILDCLSVNVEKIDERYFWTLGDATYLTKNGMNKLKSSYVKNIPSNIVCGINNNNETKDDSNVNNDSDDSGSELSGDEGSGSHGGNGDNDSDDSGIDEPAENVPDFMDCFEAFLNDRRTTPTTPSAPATTVTKKEFLVNGLLLRKDFLRGIVDGLKCRIGLKNLESLIGIDFSNNIYKFELNCTNVISLLLEISSETIHQQIMSGAIEQQIPIPILYPMCNIHVTKSNSSVNVNYYLRDTLHLASQSKLMNDVKCQTHISRNKPLIMFSGSDKVNGKSSLLEKVFKNENFNVFGDNEIDFGTEPSVLHKNSVDLIYLKDQSQCNFHILDVHGSINDPFFQYCSKKENEKMAGMSRMGSLVGLASLCHCVVIQIDRSQLTSNVEAKRRKKIKEFSVESLISKSKGKNILTFIAKLKKACDLKMILIVRDATAKDEKNVQACKMKDEEKAFVCAKKKISDEFCIKLTKHLNFLVPSEKEKENYVNGDSVWWKQTTAFGLVMPLKYVQVFSNNEVSYTQRKKKEIEFRNILQLQFSGIKNPNIDGPCPVEDFLPFAAEWEKFTLEQRKAPGNEKDENLQDILVKARTISSSPVLQVFMKYCLGLNSSSPRIGDKTNREVEHKENLNDNKTKTESKLLRLGYLYILSEVCNDLALNDSDIRSYDLLQNCHALLALYKQNCIMYKSIIDSVVSVENQKWFEQLEYAIIEFLRDLFSQGSTIEFTDGKYKCISDSMGDEFGEAIFGSPDSGGGGGGAHDGNMIAIGCAGPQSIGKSTFLRRAFGVDTKSSAGRTTQGINFCKISYDSQSRIDKLVVIDTEGIDSQVATTEGKKQNNKTILGTLASSDVFLYHCTREVKSAKLLDVVLWAYEKLHLTHQNKKELCNIKLMFIIRDCNKEYNDETWFAEQKKEINERIVKAFKELKSSGVYESDDEDEWLDAGDEKKNGEIKKNLDISQDKRVQRMIDQIRYFALPSAISDNGEPSDVFAIRCGELREVILDLVEKYNIRYDSQSSWYEQTKCLWNQVITYENVLSISDFTTMAQHNILEKVISKQFKQVERNLQADTDELMNNMLTFSNIHAIRCSEYNRRLNDLFENEIKTSKECIIENDKLNNIPQDLIKKFLFKFEHRCDVFISDKRLQFTYQSQKKIHLDTNNIIMQLLNNAKTLLRGANERDTDKVIEEYKKAFIDKITEIGDKNVIKMELKKLDLQLREAYSERILSRNKSNGTLPSDLNHLIKLDDIALPRLTIKQEDEEKENSRGGRLPVLPKALQGWVGGKNEEKFDDKFIDIDFFETIWPKQRDKIIDLHLDTQKCENLFNTSEWIAIINDCDKFIHHWIATNYNARIVFKTKVYGGLHCNLLNSIYNKLDRMYRKENSKIVIELRNQMNSKEKLSEFLLNWNKIEQANTAATKIGDLLFQQMKSTIKSQLKSKLNAQLDNHSKKVNPTYFYLEAFKKAFKPINSKSNPLIAKEFIENQILYMTQEINNWIKERKNEFLTDFQTSIDNENVSLNLDEYVSHLIDRYIENVILAINEWEKSISHESSVNSSNLAKTYNYVEFKRVFVLRYFYTLMFSSLSFCCFGFVLLVFEMIVFLKRSKAINFDIEWPNDEFNRSECSQIAQLLKDRLSKEGPSIITRKELSQVTINSEKDREMLGKLLGCCHFCPICGAKCQEKSTLVDGHHSTSYHFLQAFNGVKVNSSDKNNSKYLPCIDVCNSKMNAECGWLYESYLSGFFRLFNTNIVKYEWTDVKKYFDKWYDWKITPGLKEDFVSPMINCYFNHELQTQLLKNKNFKDCIEANKKKDVLCCQEIRGLTMSAQNPKRNKLLADW